MHTVNTFVISSQISLYGEQFTKTWYSHFIWIKSHSWHILSSSGILSYWTTSIRLAPLWLEHDHELLSYMPLQVFFLARDMLKYWIWCNFILRFHCEPGHYSNHISIHIEHLVSAFRYVEKLHCKQNPIWLIQLCSCGDRTGIVQYCLHCNKR